MATATPRLTAAFVEKVHRPGKYHDAFGLYLRVSGTGHRYRLFGVGDLVNRGPHSEEALGWLEQRFETVVLGNHNRSVLSWFKAKRGSPPPRFSPPPESEWLLGHPLQLAHQMFETAETLGVCLVPGRQNLVLGKQRFDYRSHRSRPGR